MRDEDPDRQHERTPRDADEPSQFDERSAVSATPLNAQDGAPDYSGKIRKWKAGARPRILRELPGDESWFTFSNLEHLVVRTYILTHMVKELWWGG